MYLKEYLVQPLGGGCVWAYFTDDGPHRRISADGQTQSHNWIEDGIYRSFGHTLFKLTWRQTDTDTDTDTDNYIMLAQHSQLNKDHDQ